MRAIEAEDPSFPRTVFVGLGDEAENKAFFGRLWPEARVVSDPKKVLYAAFGLERGSVWQLLGPSVWSAGLRAAMKGNFVGLPVGDPFQMPGLFLLQGERVTWGHEFGHAGDAPDFRRLASEFPIEQE